MTSALVRWQQLIRPFPDKRVGQLLFRPDGSLPRLLYPARMSPGVIEAVESGCCWWTDERGGPVVPFTALTFPS